MFKVGETYKTKGGTPRTLVAIASDGRLIVEGTHGLLSYRASDGSSSKYDRESLVDPDAVTEEERELVLKLYNVAWGREDGTTPHGKYLLTADPSALLGWGRMLWEMVKILREAK